MKQLFRKKFSWLFTLAIAMLVVLPFAAFADGIEADADDLVAESPHGNSTVASQQAGTTVEYDFSSQIKNTGNSSNDVLPGTVTVTIARSGDWLDSSAGSPPSFSFTAYDTPAAGTIRISVPCDAQANTLKTMTVNLTAGASSNGKTLSPNSVTLSYNITATTPAAASCTSSNAAPSVAANNASVSVNEGQTATNSGTYSDANSGDNVTISASVGSVTKTGTNNGTWSWSFATTDGPDESQTVTITADDGHGGIQTTFSLVVNNVAPTVTLSGPSSANEGDTKSYSFIVSDPGDDTFSVVSASCGTNGTFSNGVFDGVTGAGSFDCTFPDGPASSNVSVQVKDSDGANSNTDSKIVTVANVAPSLSMLAISGNSGTACANGNDVKLSFTFTDPAGSNDTYTGSINWGDSTSTSFSSSPQTDVTHHYSAGAYTIKVNVHDEDGGNAVEQTTSVNLLYNTSGILQPINSTGARSAFKLGSTIPVKVRITDCQGNAVSSLSPKVSLVKLDGSPDGIATEDFYSTVPDQGTSMRFTGSPDYQYIFNLGTKNLSVGDFKVTISDPTIASVSATFSIKK